MSLLEPFERAPRPRVFEPHRGVAAPRARRREGGRSPSIGGSRAHRRHGGTGDLERLQVRRRIDGRELGRSCGARHPEQFRRDPAQRGLGVPRAAFAGAPGEQCHDGGREEVAGGVVESLRGQRTRSLAVARFEPRDSRGSLDDAVEAPPVGRTPRRELGDDDSGMPRREVAGSDAEPRKSLRAVPEDDDVGGAEKVVEALPPARVREIEARRSLAVTRVEVLPRDLFRRRRVDPQDLGADYRLRSLPLTLGGNLNHTPGYEIRLDTDRWAVQPDKTVIDAYALWVFNPELQLRLSLGNALAQDYLTQTRVVSNGQLESVANNARSYVNWQLRLEMKL